ncbi:hypothetical protein NDA11_006337 [Ustilago hordei]|uniref:Uncharacterized protein n=1 Tax=Ustilago hordei TaxID=120017 RepID=I2FMP7_USTHO|nr:hypothetical protein NDA10_001638 [Ustilago hordei]KAJ1583412.1 hypothetical protein NDA15_003238 [Ustilago hordei]KAJ1586817.1 hypothetical protein NDA11_006337 [Ustilago hordei]KAJ1591638.1 hypothetical protein NDA12_001786 [Ustilago hordei]UTT94488.1 hypothetical protein NDA17_005053 [Ustilago hordei]
MDDDTVISPLPSLYLAPIVPNPMGNAPSLDSPAINLYEVDSRRAALEMTTPEHQAVWEAKLAQSPTPPPAADEVINMILLAPWPETLPGWVTASAASQLTPAWITLVMGLRVCNLMGLIR